MKMLLDIHGDLSLWRYHTEGVADVFSIQCGKCRLQFAGGSEVLVRGFWADMAHCPYCSDKPITATRSL